MSPVVVKIPYQLRSRSRIIPWTIARPQFTELYCQSGGSNLNGGSDTNNAATYTATNGNWDGSSVYIPTDGSNPYQSGVRAGSFVIASVYLDAATVGVYLAQVIGVTDAVNGTIKLSTTAAAGTAPASGATGRSIKIGGAFKGPNAATGFPLILPSLSTLGSFKQLRVNLKNDATYSVTASFAPSTTGSAYITQGYSLATGDGGKATIDGGASTATIWTQSGPTGNTFIDLIFSTSFASGSSDLLTCGTVIFTRCVFAGARGFALTGTTYGFECEFYNCNTSNTAATGAVNGGVWNRCIFHGMSGSNNCGIVNTGGGVDVRNSIFDRCGKNAISIPFSAGAGGYDRIMNNDFYRNGSDAISISGVSTTPHAVWIENNNFVQNGGAGINNTPPNVMGYSYSNAYVDNRVADTLGNIVEPYGKIVYPVGVTPYNDPVNGDFTIILAAAIGAGRGGFTETQSYSAPNTVGYPDIGAAQAQTLTQSFAVPTTQILPYGYLNHTYLWKWAFFVPTAVTILSGGLPPGLLLTQATPSTIFILGTPTTIGTYDFVLRSTIGTSTGDATFEISIFDDPDEGVGAVGGG